MAKSRLTLATPWNVACQAPWSMGFSSELPFPSPKDIIIDQKVSSMTYVFAVKVSNMQNMNFQMFKLVLEKAEEPELKSPTSAGSWKKQESSRKTSISALLTMPKPLTVWITINCGKF